MQLLSQELGIHEGRSRTFHVSIPSLSKSCSTWDKGRESSPGCCTGFSSSKSSWPEIPGSSLIRFNPAQAPRSFQSEVSMDFSLCSVRNHSTDEAIPAKPDPSKTQLQKESLPGLDPGSIPGSFLVCGECPPRRTKLGLNPQSPLSVTPKGTAINWEQTGFGDGGGSLARAA